MKRLGNFGDSTNKKPKTDKDVDDLWGDDDDFALIATQICEIETPYETLTQQNQNASVLPSYNSFMEPKNLFSSTQANSHKQGPNKNVSLMNISVINPIPSTSGTSLFKAPPDKISANNELLKLKQEYADKEGEVSILREQLRTVKTSLAEEHARKHKELTDLLKEKIRELSSCRGELEFKNLEVLNLKQKVNNVSKANLDSTILAIQNQQKEEEKTKQLSETVQKTEEIFETSPILSVTSFEDFPLKNRLPPNLFKVPQKEKYTFNIKQNMRMGRTSFLIENETTQNLTKFPENNTDINSIFGEMFKITQYNQDELNLEESNQSIKKVLEVSLQLLYEMYDYLKILESHIRNEDIKKMDSVYLQSDHFYSITQDTLDYGDEEIGIKASRLIYFLSEVLPYNNHLCKLVLLESSLNYASLNNRENRHKHFEFLNHINDVVMLIFQIRKTSVTVCFLTSVVNLLEKICETPHFDNVHEIFSNIASSILFTRPSGNILYKFTFVLKKASKFPKICDFLCKKPSQIEYKSDKKRNLFYFNLKSCKMSLFFCLFNKVLKRVIDDNILTNITVNLLCFIYNLLNSSPAFMMYQEKLSQCECLSDIYGLGIGVVYRVARKYQENQSAQLEITLKWSLKLLVLLTANSENLTSKYIKHYAQYMKIISLVKDIQDPSCAKVIEDLQSMNIDDDLPKISAKSLADL